MVVCSTPLAARLSVRQQAGGSPTDSRTCQAYPGDAYGYEWAEADPSGRLGSSSYPDFEHV